MADLFENAVQRARLLDMKEEHDRIYSTFVKDLARIKARTLLKRRRTQDEIARDEAIKFLATEANGGPMTLAASGRGSHRACRTAIPAHRDE